ncbi:hypothetical protein FEM48_Zijuj01G0298100 [Ziziphus jujuba var. spinosa]|uniref:Acyl-[acyl-carrier-protein] hydrolase n=1 Tax=Ziziphus jujuba var. spinosa TaxID=714518 RepID=A0A978W5U4_ZIZJJ|nr:palmitoyl-acyl carrier protein thioesterase, chloroplastic-like [Ziziphus jujuba var. spinosa]XP_048323507.1 palmitoyl-acyl carrier protein thioesterase, chloroplastic-like [Ziziphus jujuba var. spinosa]XP_048323540.1 palmitoyl-acyl carrier protein thioesterase, chloroplastic-like [Ziziphus jujuba var. spinosa]KAH7547328.1 hypothetical protein FEM48_Zijuj01G0298100 [Ziziphus jujuba var. spinosa]
MLKHLAAPRPLKGVPVPISTLPSSTNETTINCRGIRASLTESGRNKPNFALSSSLQSNLNSSQPYQKEAIGKMGLEHFNLKPTKQPEKNADNLFEGRLLQGGLVFQQNFSIRVSELDSYGKASIRALINILQESAFNHFKYAGILSDDFGSTPKMKKRNMTWVVSRMQIVVDSYPSWSDVIQVKTWTCVSGRNGMRRDWIVSDFNTGETLLRAVCVYVMMNKRTRKLCKFIDEVKEETKGIFMDTDDPIIDDNEDGRKLRDLDVETADIVHTGLLPKWSDLDFNQHVNHVTYIDWLLESVPHWILESQKLSSITLEFRKECGMNTVLQSLCSVARDGSPKCEGVELEHTICLEKQSHILLRGRTSWMPKSAQLETKL